LLLHLHCLAAASAAQLLHDAIVACAVAPVIALPRFMVMLLRQV